MGLQMYQMSIGYSLALALSLLHIGARTSLNYCVLKLRAKALGRRQRIQPHIQLSKVQTTKICRINALVKIECRFGITIASTQLHSLYSQVRFRPGDVTPTLRVLVMIITRRVSASGNRTYYACTCSKYVEQELDPLIGLHRVYSAQRTLCPLY